MGKKSYTEEIVTKVAASRLFMAGGVDMIEVGPKVLPGKITGIKVVEGDGGIGSVIQIDYTDAELGSLKERVDKVDPATFETQLTIIEGGPIGKKLESIVHHMKLVPQPDGGCIYRSTVEVEVLPGVEFTDEEMQELKEQDFGEFRALESYLLDNPAAYA